jgi:hypothetical protein
MFLCRTYIECHPNPLSVTLSHYIECHPNKGKFSRDKRSSLFNPPWITKKKVLYDSQLNAKSSARPNKFGFWKMIIFRQI